jgi:hypothetical protein
MDAEEEPLSEAEGESDVERLFGLAVGDKDTPKLRELSK